MDKLSKFLFGIFLIFALFAGWLFSVFATDLYWGIRSMGWMAVPARVTAVNNADAPGRARFEVSYAYSINGTSWNSDAVAYGGDEDSARLLISTLVPGATLSAFVDPDAPQRAVLIPGITAAGIFFTLFPLLFALIPLSFALGLLFARKGGRRFERAVDALVLLLLLMLSLLPATAALLVAHQFYLGMMSASWPVTSGTVLVSSSHAKLESDQSSRRASRFTRYQKLDLVVAYQVGQQRCTSNAIDFLSDFPTAERTIRLQRAHPVNAIVKLHYNPQQPCQAVIKPGVGWYGGLMLLMTVGFTCLFGVPLARRLRRGLAPAATSKKRRQVK